MDSSDGSTSVLIARLRALGAQTVDDTIARQHLAAIERVSLLPDATSVGVPRLVQVRFRRVRVIAAATAAGLLGASGLAAAGALPDPAQNLAHDALGVVGLHVPRAADDCQQGAADPSASPDCDDAPAVGD